MAQEKIGAIKKIAAAVQETVSSVQAKSNDSPVMTEEQKRDEAPPAPTPELNPRNQAMAEIAARAKETRAAEASETIAQGEDDLARAAEEANAASEQLHANEEEENVHANKEAGAPEGFDPNAEYELLVEGKQVKVKGSQIIDTGKRALQKETAADYKLELASRLLTEAQQRSAVQQPPQQGVAQPQAQPEQSAPSDADLAQIIQFGTTEQAAQAISEIRRRSQPSITPEAIQQMMTRALPAAITQQMSFQKAVDFVQNEYGDLLSDPYLKPLFISEENRRRAAGDTSDHTTLYKTIGEDLRKHFNRPKVGAPANPAPTLQERKEAKAAAPAAPKLASVRMSGGGDQPKPKTREEIIAGMRASRGQDSLH